MQPRNKICVVGAVYWKKNHICGVTIGRYALIGSGAIVTKDVPDFSLVVGNPCRVVGLIDKQGNRVK